MGMWIFSAVSRNRELELSVGNSAFAEPRRVAMNPNNSPADDTACPAAFVAVPAVVGALLWLAVMLSRLAQY
jgi:hypothetical protein